MIGVLGSFFLDFAVFLLSFRALSAPGTRLPASVRVALGLLVTFIATVWTLWTVPTPWGLLAVSAAAAVGSMSLHGEGLRGLTEALGGARFAVYLLSAATLCGLVFLFVPVTTFLTSPGEIGIHLDYLLSVNARDAMVIVYVAAALYALAVTSRMKTVLTLMALGALTLGLVYSYAMPFGYPMMTGLRFEQIPISGASRGLRILVDAAIVIAVGLGLRAVLVRYGARPIVVGLLLANVSLGAAAAVGILRDDVGGAGGPETAARLPDRPLRFSPAHPNVLIIFLDRFMGSFVESILQTHPELAERLSGFTWYPRTVSAGENSIVGVHPMLGGYDYLPVEMNARGKLLRDVSVEAYSILPYNFSRKGYRVNVVSPRGLGFTMAGDCKFLDMDGVHCTHISPSVSKRRAEQMGFPLNDLSKSSYADLLVLLASMRGAPYTVKEVVLQKGPWRPFLDHSAGTTFREWAELNAFAELSFPRAQEPNLNFISNILPHEPYFMGEDCLPRRERFRVPLEEARRRGHVSLHSLQHSIAARCALLGVADYLQFLKSAGVYDNTKIVIVSDHGIHGAIEDHSTRATAGGTQDDFFVRTRSVLLVKERGAAGSLRVSDAFMPNAEVPRIVCEDIGGCVNPYLGNKPIAALGRDDPFLVSIVPWQFSQQNRHSFVIEEQLALSGKDPFNAKGWAVIPDAPGQ